MSITEIKAEILNLPNEEQIELLRSIMDAWEDPDPNDSNEDSLIEANKRADELRDGTAVGIPADQFIAEIEASRKR